MPTLARRCCFGYEVDAVIEMPAGALPTAMPGLYEADLAGICSYLAGAGADIADAAHLMNALT